MKPSVARALVTIQTYASHMKKDAAVKGHSVDDAVNQYEMGRAAAYQDVERLITQILDNAAKANKPGNTATP